MVKSKKMLGIVLASMLALASMITSFAASNQDVLLALEDGIALRTGEKFYLSVENMQVAKNYLAEKGLSSSDLDAVLADIRTVQKIAPTLSSLNELAKNSDVTGAIKNASSITGVKVIPAASGNIVLTDANGKILLNVNKENTPKDKPDYSVVNSTSGVANNNNATTGTVSTGAIKQTGAEVDLTNMTIVVSAAILILAGLGFTVYKFNLLRD